MTVRSRRGTSARTRIVAVLLTVLTVTLGLVVAVTWTFLTVRDVRRADDALVSTGAEFDALAATAVDPQTGEPYATVRALLQAAVDQSVPAPDETRFAVLNGEVISRTTHGYPNRVDDDATLVAAVSAATTRQIATAPTAGEDIRYLVLPVTGSDGQGAYVAAVVRDVAVDQVRQIVAVVAAVGVLGLLVAAGAGWSVAGSVLRPLDRLRSATGQITERDLGQRIPESGTDDVRALTRSFNHMLDRLERAFAAQRRFAADAGHELRTPLTVLRGHTELLSENPEIRAEQRAVMLDEIDRMSAMVEDLLALIRLDRSPELCRTPLVTTDLVTRWRQLASGLPTRTWTWIEDGATIDADPRRLHQVFLQLAHNAIAATGDGDVIEVGVVALDGGAALWVADAGPGIPRREWERIFAPFARGSVRSQGGSGLGLAIVEGIAQAHGGTVAVVGARPIARPEPWPGGACLLVSLPDTVPQ